MTRKTNAKLSKDQRTKLATFSTKSGQIRYLNSLDWTRGDIHRHLGVLYQHVRNVLITPVKTPRES